MNELTHAVREESRRVRTAPPREAWFATQDHLRLARVWAAVGALALVAGLLLALGLAFAPFAQGTSGSLETARRLATMHGLALVALVLVPAIPNVLGNALLPRALGVEGMAWPGLNRLALHVHLLGALLFAAAFAFAPADTGWSLDAPYVFESRAALAWTLLGLLGVGLASACSAACFVATIVASQKSRPEAIAMPLFAFGIGVASLVQIACTPLLCVAVVLVVAQRGGAADLFGASAVAVDVQFARWFFAWAHPAIGAAVIAAVAVVDDVVAVATGGRRDASRASVACVLALGVAAFAGAGMHLIGREGAHEATFAASALALASGIPFAGLVASWLGTLAERPARSDASLAMAACAIVLLVCGALAGMFQALVPSAVLLQNTTFASASLHFVALGVLAAFFAGALQESREWLGAAARGGLARASAALLAAGSLAAFAPGLVLGFLGEPRRTREIVAGGEPWTLVAGVGGAVAIVAVLLAASTLVAAFLAGRARLPEEADA